jgi:hypothetical protein
MEQPSFASRFAGHAARTRKLLRRSVISLAGIIVLFPACILGIVALRSSGHAFFQGSPLLLTLSVFLGILVVSTIVLVGDIVRFRSEIREYDRLSKTEREGKDLGSLDGVS